MEPSADKERVGAAAPLQRQVGLAVALFSTFIAAVSFFYGLAEGESPIESFLHPTVSVVLLWAIVAGLTALKESRLGQIVQVALVTAVMFQSALSSVTTELTSLLFFGLAIALSYAYDLFEHQLRYYAIATAAALIVSIWLQMQLLGAQTIWAMIQWLLGALMIVVLYFIILKAANRWVRNREQQLAREVRARTREVREALHQSEQLRERNDVLLKEVQHRTKNNLQLITSLLSLQQSDPDVESRAVADVLETTRRRIQAMATAHELLHSSGRTSTISLKQFVLELTNEFVRSDRVNDVHVDTPLDSDVKVEMDFAAPLGLIITELVANSAEHAIVPDGVHDVWIHLSLDDATLGLTVEDRGTEFPDNISIDSPTTTGLQIIAALVSQIRGEINLERTPNTKWTVRAPLPSPTVEDDADSADETGAVHHDTTQD